VEDREIRPSTVYVEVEHMFFGQFDHNIDDKGRLTIPARYRNLLEGGAYIMLGFDDNLMVMQHADFEKLSTKFREQNFANSNTRQMGRMIFGSADRLDLDKNGRILIPQFLREAVGISGSAKLIGMGAIFEVWSPDLWAEKQALIKDGNTRAELFSDMELSF